MVKLILCGSVVQRYFKKTDTLKEDYYYRLAAKLMRNVVKDHENTPKDEAKKIK